MQCIQWKLHFSKLILHKVKLLYFVKINFENEKKSYKTKINYTRNYYFFRPQMGFYPKTALDIIDLWPWTKKNVAASCMPAST